jgi:DNA-binding NarL/FixJ family response regulator
MFNRDEYVFHALRAGASGFLLKDVRGGQLTRAIRAVAAGDSLVDPAITRRLIEERVTAERRPNPDRVPQIGTLTQRELDVLQRVARGLSNAEIAADLVVGEATVKTHVAHVLAKLGVRDRVQAVVAAYEAGVVTVRSGH